jgi:hypothetical protein
MSKPLVLKKEERSLFTESYDAYRISKHFSPYPETEDSFEQIAASVTMVNNQDYQLRNLGWKLAIEENKLIVKNLLEMTSCYNQKDISLVDLKELIVNIDPHSIRVLILSPLVQKELILKNLIEFNPENKCYELLGRKVISVANEELNDKIIFICDQILYIVESNGIIFNENNRVITVNKELQLWYSHGYSVENNFEVFNL